MRRNAEINQFIHLLGITPNPDDCQYDEVFYETDTYDIHAEYSLVGGAGIHLTIREGDRTILTAVAETALAAEIARNTLSYYGLELEAAA